VETAISTLASVVGSDLKAKDMEIGIVTKDDPCFRVMALQEVDGYLSRMAEK